MSKGQLKCTLLDAYSITNRPNEVLKILVRSIEQGQVKPFFTKCEIGNLFRREILSSYADGRYFAGGPKSIADWADIIGNHAMPPLMNKAMLESKLIEQEPEIKVVFAHQMILTTRRLKVIEDWIFHNPHAQADIKKII